MRRTQVYTGGFLAIGLIWSLAVASLVPDIEAELVYAAEHTISNDFTTAASSLDVSAAGQTLSVHGMVDTVHTRRSLLSALHALPGVLRVDGYISVARREDARKPGSKRITDDDFGRLPASQAWAVADGQPADVHDPHQLEGLSAEINATLGQQLTDTQQTLQCGLRSSGYTDSRCVVPALPVRGSDSHRAGNSK